MEGHADARGKGGGERDGAVEWPAAGGITRGKTLEAKGNKDGPKDGRSEGGENSELTSRETGENEARWSVA